MADLTYSVIRGYLDSGLRNDSYTATGKARDHIVDLMQLIATNSDNTVVSAEQFDVFYSYIKMKNREPDSDTTISSIFKILNNTFKLYDQYKVYQVRLNIRNNESLQTKSLDVLNKYGLFYKNSLAENDIEERNVVPYGIKDVITQTLSFIMPQFMLAIIDEDMVILKAMLDAYPQLLLMRSQPGLVIESQLTWQRFYADMAFTMAAQRKQTKLIQFLEPYFEKLEILGFIENANETMLEQWGEGDDNPETSDNYKHDFDGLIKAFTEESFEHGILSDGTERALALLNEKLHPDKPIVLSTYIDLELLLLAAYEAYDINFGEFRNWKQRDEFCVRVIGRIQSVLKREMAEIYCEGVDEMSRAPRRDISVRARNLQTGEGGNFYPSRGGRTGTGFSQFVSVYAGSAGSGEGAMWPYGTVQGRTAGVFKTVVEQSRHTLKDFMQHLQEPQNQPMGNRK